MTDYLNDREREIAYQRYPHARAFGEALGTRLGATLPSIGTYTVGKATPVREYRATFARGAKGITAPIHAELQATIFAPSYIDAERCAEHIARDGVCYLIACGIVQ